MNDTPIKHSPFFYVTLEGTAYEIGRQQGELVRGIPGWLQFVRSGKDAFNPEERRQVSALFDRHCPGLNDEIRGLADGAGIQFDEVMYYAITYMRAGNCSHLAVLPAAASDGHVLVARNYEFGDQEDDMRLCTTRVQGKYAHLGFSSLLFGRNDGMNEHGLSVTMSSGGIPVGKYIPPIQSGFQFWALIRHLLENCRSVEEVLGEVEDFPLCGNTVLIAADRSGKAALIEFYGPHKAVRCIDAQSANPAVYATNHYTLPEMQSWPVQQLANSPVRYQTIERFVSAEAPKIDRGKLKLLFGSAYPQGLTCHYYAEYFGTLHSLVFDLTSGEAEICFGSPIANPWRRFDLATPSRPEPYMTALPQETAEADFWKGE
ncbi:MAG TPA: C45 family peptidase [Anaerolineaceae bacterium]|nr:C45 family peptidase [Anaerolineaceae bacterium]